MKGACVSSLPPNSPPVFNELLDTKGNIVNKISQVNEFDVLFHLFGEQRLPSIFGIRQFNSKKHIFVNSKKYPADIMKQFVDESKWEELLINPFDPKNVEMNILQTISKMPSDCKIGFNLTGGTKLMYAGALSASKKVNGVPFYFESKNNNLIYLNDFSVEKCKRVNNVETFLKANIGNMEISNNGYWDDVSDRNNPQRTKLTKHLWKRKNKIVNLYRELTKYNNETGKPFQVKKGNISTSLSKEGKAEITIDSERYVFQNWFDFAKYLTGGWFEEYVFLTLKPLLETGKIKDIRIGLEISFKEKNVSETLDWKDKLKNINGQLYQELDAVYTDGKKLYIIECKAGRVTAESVMKLQNITRYYGGVEGRGLLASVFQPYSKIVVKKIQESKNIKMVTGNKLEKNTNLIF